MSLCQWVAGQGPEPRPLSCLSCLCWAWGGQWPEGSAPSVQPALPTAQVKAPHLPLPICLSFLNSKAGNTVSSLTGELRALSQLNQERLWNSACPTGGALDHLPRTHLLLSHPLLFQMQPQAQGRAELGCCGRGRAVGDSQAPVAWQPPQGQQSGRPLLPQLVGLGPGLPAAPKLLGAPSYPALSPGSLSSALEGKVQP